MQEIVDLTKNTLLYSAKFPYRTGKLRNNFIDRNSTIIGDYDASFTVLSNPEVNYGRILENAPSIRYRLRRVDNKNRIQYSYVRHNNRHFRYIERIIESDVVPALENSLGVEKI